MPQSQAIRPRAQEAPQGPRRGEGLLGAQEVELQVREGAGRALARLRLPRPARTRSATFRQLWIVRINAAARANGMSYNQFISGLHKAGHRARPQGPRRPGRDRPGGLHGDRRAGQGGARVAPRQPDRQRPGGGLPPSGGAVRAARSPLYADLCRALADDPRVPPLVGELHVGRPRCACCAGLHALVLTGRAELGRARRRARASRAAAAGGAADPDERGAALVAAPAVLPRARAADGRRGARPDRARPERRLQPPLGSLPLRVRGGRVGAADALARARRRGAAPGAGTPARARAARAPTASASTSIRSTSRPTRGRCGCARSSGRGRRAGSSGSTARSRRCGASRRSSCAATWSTCCRALLADRARRRAHGRLRDRGARLPRRTSRGRSVGEALDASGRDGGLALVWTDRPADGVHDYWGLWLRLWPGGEPQPPRARRLPRRLARVAVITSATNPTLKLVRKLLVAEAQARRARALRGRGRGPRRGGARGRPRAGRAARRRRDRRGRAARRRSRRCRTRRARSPSSAPPTCRASERETTLALWRVADPGNVGTLLRAADAFGAAVALSRRVRRSARPEGAARVGGRDLPRPARRVRRRARAPRSRSSPTAARRCTSSSSPARSRSSSEPSAKGCPRTLVAQSQRRVATIELPGAAESLNVAVAGAIALYERSRRY